MCVCVCVGGGGGGGGGIWQLQICFLEEGLLMVHSKVVVYGSRAVLPLKLVKTA